MGSRDRLIRLGFDLIASAAENDLQCIVFIAAEEIVVSFLLAVLVNIMTVRCCGSFSPAGVCVVCVTTY